MKKIYFIKFSAILALSLGAVTAAYAQVPNIESIELVVGKEGERTGFLGFEDEAPPNNVAGTATLLRQLWDVAE